ncbi:Acetyltransferase [Tenacibaculum sp. 190524A02b]|uniref:GNAT family N-acetyltransferase n=1 Tax=Tenacibaculum vairaonense TaxID=3137860 RepID=UPI0032B16E31
MNNLPTIRIRKAKHTDLEILLDFEQEIIKAERPYGISLKEEKISYYDIAAMIDAEEVEVLVAVDREELVGSGYVRVQENKPYLKYPTHAFLGFMYVKPSHRGKGVNKLIVETLLAWAKTKGLVEVKLDVYAGNLPAIRAYEKAGFEGYLLNMRTTI